MKASGLAKCLPCWMLSRASMYDEHVSLRPHVLMLKGRSSVASILLKLAIFELASGLWTLVNGSANPFWQDVPLSWISWRLDQMLERLDAVKSHINRHSMHSKMLAP